MTGPYFHDASAATLEDAVRKMAYHQIGVELEEAEVSLLVAWLRTLTGQPPQRYLMAPELPPDGSKQP
jgi:cytochrome c peroxidase